ncbi:MAG: N-acetyltransferase family protein [Dehalococcoidia bacterium]
MESELRFTSTLGQHGGLIASMLKRSYAELIRADPEHWGREVPEWEQFDHEVFEHPDTVDRCVFLSWSRGQLVGFASYDPRQGPKLGIVGHNCVLPEFRGNGFGNQQIEEIIRRFRAEGIRLARASTGESHFFAPARRMYAACGFREAGRRPWHGDPSQNTIEYELTLDKQDSRATRLSAP